MGGTLTASSEGPGKGATFTLHLPTRSEEERASKADLQQAA